MKGHLAVAVARDSRSNVYAGSDIALRSSPVVGRVEPTVEGPAVLFKDDVHLGGTYLRCKRVMDILGALLLATVFSPIMLFVALSLARSGQVIFSHERVGRFGVPFKIYKFRSMVTDSDRVLAELLAADPSARAEWETDHKLRDDPRITRIGAFLRKSSLDELPQLWNVIRGEMSLVGPRPVIREELKKYGRATRYYLVAKPGITGLWQVMGRNDVDYRRRIAMDRRYARSASLWGDVVVLFKTVKVVLARSGAY